MKNRYYWDACIFIAWIKDEGVPPRKAGEMDGVAQIVEEVDRGDAILVASSIIHTEVFPSGLNQEQRTKLSLALKRPSVYLYNADIKVCRLAGEIRDYYRQNKSKTLKLADTIHIATAIIAKASAMHTFEDRLLKLNGNVAGHPLTISKPAGIQGILPGMSAKK